MDPNLAQAAKYIGAGLAAIGTGAAGIGVGTLFGQFLNGALRNPSAVEGQFGRLIFGFAVTEALGIFASQLVWFAIAFGFLYWYLAKRGLPQLGAVIESRKARIAGDLDEATAMQQKADVAAAAHEKTLAEARAKAQSL